jgi:hypothetical protein
MNKQSDSGRKGAERTGMYGEPGGFRRLAGMVRGLRKPRQTREYKEAVIELQRLSAPVAAVALPVLVVALLTAMSGGGAAGDRPVETRVLDLDVPDVLKPLDDPVRREQEKSEFDTEVVIDAFDVEVSADLPERPAASPSPIRDAVILPLKTPVVLKNFFSGTRDAGARDVLRRRYDGDTATEAAVMCALRWLKKNQQPDGAWKNQRVAMTGLAVLTFLAHGEKPGDSPEFGGTVQRALEFLLKNQRADGRFNGMDGNEYAHPIAAYALCEAYGMTLNPNVKAAAEKALAPILRGQHPTGGWTYHMDPGMDKETGSYRDDTSYMGWCAQALKAAKLAGVRADGLDKAMKLAVKGFKKNAGPDGGFGYTGPGKGGLTSVGTLCMQLLGASGEPEVRKSLRLVDAWTPTFTPYALLESEIRNVKPEELARRGKDGKEVQRTPLEVAKARLAGTLPEDERMFFGGSAQYYFYYATQCKFHEGGKPWTIWNSAMKPHYVKAQRIERDAAEDDKGRACDIGWWENGDAHTDRPVMDTCLAALQLMVYYRYLPTLSKAAVQAESELAASATDIGDIGVDIGNF